MVKITFNSLKLSRTKTGKLKKTKTGKNIYVWRKPKGKKRRPSPSQIREFKGLRSRGAVKRERERREFKEQFKFHRTTSKNLTFEAYCKDFKNGIRDLHKLFKSLGLAKKVSGQFRIRFYVGSWKASCLDTSVKCPGRMFIAHTKKDKYKMAREQPDLTNDNFIDRYKNYLINANFQAGGIYLSEVCPRCPSGALLIEFIKVCFQVIKVRK